MTRLYFQHFESTYRIFHVPSFWREYEGYWSSENEAPMSRQLKILLVVAIGSSVCNRGEKEIEYRNDFNQWVYAAQAWLSGPLEKDRLSITGIQIHCITILAREVLNIGGDLIWTSAGSLLHFAMRIGLHRDPNQLSGMSLLQPEIRRRLWATVLEMVVQSSLDSEMPPRIVLDEFDTEWPSNVNDEEMDGSTVLLRPHPREEYTATCIQLALLSSLPARIRLTHRLNGLDPAISFSDAHVLSSELTISMQASNRLHSGHVEPAMTPFHRNLLDFMVRRFMMPLWIPFVCKPGQNPLFYYSRKTALESALALVSIEHDDSFQLLLEIGGSLFKSGIRGASVIISFELLAQTKQHSLDGTLLRNSECRDILKRAVKKLVDISGRRIQHGESNVKNHMFLSVVLAETESIECGTGCEEEIARGAVTSLQYCHDLLLAQAGSPGQIGDGADFSISSSEQESYWMDFDMDLFLQDGLY